MSRRLHRVAGGRRAANTAGNSIANPTPRTYTSKGDSIIKNYFFDFFLVFFFKVTTKLKNM